MQFWSAQSAHSQLPFFGNSGATILNSNPCIRARPANNSKLPVTFSWQNLPVAAKTRIFFLFSQEWHYFRLQLINQRCRSIIIPIAPTLNKNDSSFVSGISYIVCWSSRICVIRVHHRFSVFRRPFSVIYGRFLPISTVTAFTGSEMLALFFQKMPKSAQKCSENPSTKLYFLYFTGF